MAATPKPGGYSLTQFVAEATKEPWVLRDDDGAAIATIEQPTGARMKAAAAALDAGDVTRWQMVELVAGDEAFAVLDRLVDDGPESLAERFWASIEEHFGWGNSAASPGS